MSGGTCPGGGGGFCPVTVPDRFYVSKYVTAVLSQQSLILHLHGSDNQVS